LDAVIARHIGAGFAQARAASRPEPEALPKEADVSGHFRRFSTAVAIKAGVCRTGSRPDQERDGGFDTLL
jgi:hypothetical protein